VDRLDRRAGVVQPGLDNYLVMSNAADRAVDPIEAALAVALLAQRRVAVAHHPHRPIALGRQPQPLQIELLVAGAERAVRGPGRAILDALLGGLHKLLGPLGPLARDDHPFSGGYILAQLGHIRLRSGQEPEVRSQNVR